MRNLTGQKVFISSDFHAYHRNLTLLSSWRSEFGEIPLEQVRHFENEIQMSNQLIKNINSKVGENDVLIHLGDWSFGGVENIYKFRKEIICKNIIQIRGNHDQHIGEGKTFQKEIDENEFSIERFEHGYNTIEIDKCFDSIHDIFKFKYGKYNFVCSHFPFLSWENISKGWMNLHGHFHNKGEGRFTSHNQMDVGIDGSPTFSPYSIEEVIELIQENNKNFSKDLPKYF